MYFASVLTVASVAVAVAVPSSPRATGTHTAAEGWHFVKEIVIGDSTMELYEPDATTILPRQDCSGRTNDVVCASNNHAAVDVCQDLVNGLNGSNNQLPVSGAALCSNGCCITLSAQFSNPNSRTTFSTGDLGPAAQAILNQCSVNGGVGGLAAPVNLQGVCYAKQCLGSSMVC